jgi:hypothetical protein
MILEEVGTGWKLTYKVVGPTAAASTVSTVLTPLDGKEAPVLINGEPSGQNRARRNRLVHHCATERRSHGSSLQPASWWRS